MLPVYSNDKGYKSYGGGGVIEAVSSWLRLILSEKTSRNLFGFLLLNLSFAFVELTYGVWTNSLGLISDAFHMFFDCTALIGGLMASIVTRWAANERFSYGYVRAEILAGFANGIFLVFIAFYIFTEAVERLFEPPEVKHERLFIISVLGLLVNFVGIFVFQHGGAHHGHSHGGDDAGHGHSHSAHGHSHSVTGNHHSHGNPLLNNVPSTPNFVSESHSHMNGGHGHDHHGHSHGGGAAGGGSQSQIMQGVFLHILADTLGSVGVIISALLMSNFGWMIADPICSLFIASLVALSVYPLLRDSISVIMQRTPKSLENQLPSCYHRINSLEGVHSIHEPHFWTLCTDQYVGTIGVEIARTADYVYIQNTVRSIFTQIGVKQVYIEIHYANS